MEEEGRIRRLRIRKKNFIHHFGKRRIAVQRESENKTTRPFCLRNQTIMYF